MLTDTNKLICFLIFCIVITTTSTSRSQTGICIKGVELSIISDTLSVYGNLSIISNTSLGENIDNLGTIIVHDSLKCSAGNIFKTSSTNNFGSLIFRGFKEQVITGAPKIFFNNLSIENSSGIHLQQDIYVFGTLKLLKGLFNLNGSHIFFYDLSPDINLATGTLLNESGLSYITDIQLSKPEGLLRAYSKTFSTLSKLKGFGAEITKLSGNIYLDRGHRIITNAGNGSIRKYFLLRSDDQLSFDLKFKYYESQDLVNTNLNEKDLSLFSRIIGSNLFKVEGGVPDTVNNTVYQTNLKSNKLYTLSSENCSDPPLAKLPGDTMNVCLGTQLTLNSRGMGISRIWFGSNGEILDTSQVYKITCMTEEFTKIILKVYDSRGCSNRDTTIIAARPYPVTTFSLPSFCCLRDSFLAMNTSSISRGSFTSTWILDKTDTLKSWNLKMLASRIGLNAVILKSESKYGCSTEGVKSINVNPLPQAEFSTKDLCTNKSFLFTNNSTIPVGGSIIESRWKVNDSIINSYKTPTSLEVFQYQFGQSGINKVGLEVISNAGCRHSFESTIEVYDPVKANFDVEYKCYGDSSVFINKSSGGRSPLLYHWDFGDHENSDRRVENHLYRSPGEYSVRLQVNSANNCIESFTRIAHIFPKPTVDFTHELACAMQKVTFKCTSDSAAYCLWSAMGVEKSGIITNYQFPDSGNFQVKLSLISNRGCSDSIVKDIYVNPLPQALFEVKDFCQNDSIHIFPTYISRPNKFQWTLNEVLISTDPNLHFQLLEPGKQNKLNLWIQSSTGCSSSNTREFNVFKLPVINLPEQINTCGTHYKLNAGNSGSCYYWSDGSSSQELDVNNSGLYSVSVVNQNGCINSDRCRVTLNSQVKPELGDSLKGCDSLILHSGFPDAQVEWSTGEKAEFIVLKNSDSYSVKVTDQNFCEGYDTVKVDIFQTPAINLGDDRIICGDTSIQLGNFEENLNYTWSDSLTSPVIFVNHSGIFHCTIRDLNGCSSSDTIAILFEKLPKSAIPKGMAACEKVQLHLNDAKFKYVWEGGSSPTDIIFNQSGMYKYVLLGNHCNSSDSVKITIYPTPLLELGNNRFFCEGNGIFLSPELIQDGVDYSWNNGMRIPSIWVGQGGSYTITGTNNYGCTSKDSIYVEMKTNPVIKLGDQYWLCSSDSLLLDGGNGQAGYEWTMNDSLLSASQYLWINQAGPYCLTIVNKNGCKSLKEIQVFSAENPVLAEFLSASEAVIGDSIVFINLSGPEPFSSFWNFDDGLESIESDPIHVYYLPNRYMPQLRVNNSYCDDYIRKNILIRSGLKLKSLNSNQSVQEGSSAQKIDFLIYPNPASESINIYYEVDFKSEWIIAIWNSQGIPMFTKQSSLEGTGNISISVSRFPAGLYFVQFQNSDFRKTHKFLIVR